MRKQTIYHWVLTGGEVQTGSAQNNTQTDRFILYGAQNTIYELGGNLSVAGSDTAQYGWDSATTIYLGAATSVTDTISLQGGYNILYGQGLLSASVISYQVHGNGSAQGYNIVDLDNLAGVTTIAAGGRGNDITLNGSATNKIVAGSGLDLVSVGTAGDGNLIDATAITLAGIANTVIGGDEQFSISSATTGTIGDAILLGNGNDTITVAGNKNHILLGAGSDSVTLTGNQNLVQATDPTGAGGLLVSLASSTGNTINFGTGGGEVTTTGASEVTVKQSGSAGVFVNLNQGGGKISLGNGSDTVIAESYAGSSISVGNGNDTLTASGTIIAGSGNDTISDAGAYSVITVGHPGQTNGNVNIYTDLGEHDTITINGSPTSTDSGYFGANDAITENGGVAMLGAEGFENVYHLNGLSAGSTISSYLGDTILLGSNSSAKLEVSQLASTYFTVQAPNAAGTYSGAIDITSFGSADQLSLNGLGFTDFTQVTDALTVSSVGDTLALPGGGSILFEAPVSLASSQFLFNPGTYGAV